MKVPGPLGRVLGAAAAAALLAGTAVAQGTTPNVNLIPELQSKTPEEKEQDAIKDKAYRESLKKIPDAKASNDPWGAVRGTDAPKTTSSGSAAPKPARPKAEIKAKTQDKTGTSAN